jgi:hypothetical protein
MESLCSIFLNGHIIRFLLNRLKAGKNIPKAVAKVGCYKSAAYLNFSHFSHFLNLGIPYS